MVLDSLKNWMRHKVCPGCDVKCDRLERAQSLHDISIDAVKAARRKQARRLSDVRVTVDATLKQIAERDRKRDEEGS